MNGNKRKKSFWVVECPSYKNLSYVLSPNWHELWKQEKCSSLAPPRGIFIRLNKLNLIDVNFQLQKVWKFLMKIHQTKSDPKRTRSNLLTNWNNMKILRTWNLSTNAAYEWRWKKCSKCNYKVFHGITFNEKVKELVELISMVKAECKAWT